MSKRRKALLGPVTDTDIRLLRIFYKIIECGSLSAAETELGVGRSTLSRHLSDLETRIGFSLCYRKRGSSVMELTHEGEIAWQYVDRLLTSISDFSNDLMSIQNDFSGDLSIGVMDYTYNDRNNPMLKALGGFKSKHPKVNIEISVASAHDIEMKILRRELHLGLIHPFFPIRELQYDPVYSERVGLFAGRSHLIFAQGGPDRKLTPEMVRQHSVVYRGYRESETQTRFKSQFPQGPTIHETEAVEILVRAGCYLGFLPAHTQEDNDLVELLPETFSYEYPVSIAYARDRANMPILKRFIEEVELSAHG